MKKKVLIVILVLVFCQIFISQGLTQEVKRYDQNSQEVITLKKLNKEIEQSIKSIFPFIESVKNKFSSSDSSFTLQEQEHLIQELDNCQKELKKLQLIFRLGQIDYYFSQSKSYSEQEVNRALLFLGGINQDERKILDRLEGIVEEAINYLLEKLEELEEIC